MKFINRFGNLYNSRYLMRKLIREFILKNIEKREYGIVVDLGSGKAPFKNLIKSKKYICVDIEDRAGRKDLVLADINKGIPLSDNYADLVIATEVLEHIKKPDFLIDEIGRILKPGGKVLLTTPFVWMIHEPPNDFFRYTKFGIKMMLANSGFEKITVLPSNGYLSSMCQLSNLYLRKKIFIPFVVLFNFLGLLFLKIEKNNGFYLNNLSLAYKKRIVKK